MFNLLKNKIVISLFVCLFIIVSLLFGFTRYKSAAIKNIENNVVNIVFSTDDSYLNYTKVAITSAVLSKNKDSIYKIHILCTDLTKERTDELQNVIKSRDDVKIFLYPVSLEMLKGIGEFKTKNSYITRTDLFKFLMPDLFPNLDKILYIDGDTLILNDLSELYNTDISKYYLGAVKKHNYSSEWVNLYNGSKDIRKKYTYNCGVLLFNLEKLRKDNIKEKLIKAKNSDTRRDLVTQSSYNEVIPLSKIKQLSPIYNMLARTNEEDFDVYNFKKLYKPYCDDMSSVEDLLNKAVIVHFAGHKKPWFDTDLYYADKWWYFAKIVDPNWQLEEDTVNTEN